MQGTFPSFEVTDVPAFGSATTGTTKTLSWVPQPPFTHCADRNAAFLKTVGTHPATLSAFSSAIVTSEESSAVATAASTPSCNVHNGFSQNAPKNQRAVDDDIIWCDDDDTQQNSFTAQCFQGAGAGGKVNNAAFLHQTAQFKASKLHESLSMSDTGLGQTVSTHQLSTASSNERGDSPVARAAALKESSVVCRVRSLPSKTTLSAAVTPSVASHNNASTRHRLSDPRASAAAAQTFIATTTAARHNMPSAPTPVLVENSQKHTTPNHTESPAAPHTALHSLSDTAEALAVVDPQRRKLLIPRSALSPTKGLLGRRSAPSLCLLYQSGRCHQGSNCYQVHADPEVVQQLRAEVESRPCCCAAHGDCHRGLWNPDKLSETVQGVTIHGIGIRIPLDRFAFTAGLEKLVQTNVGDPLGTSPADYGVTLGHRIVLTASRDSVCRLHGTDGGCRFGGDCKFVHVCRELLMLAEVAIRRDNAGQTVSVAAHTAPQQSATVGGPFTLTALPQHMSGGGAAVPASSIHPVAPTSAPNPTYTLCPSGSFARPMPTPLTESALYAQPPVLNLSTLQSPSHSTSSQAFYVSPAFSQTHTAVPAPPVGVPQLMYMQQYDAATGHMRLVAVNLV